MPVDDKDLELRFVDGFEYEERADGQVRIKGHAAVFDTWADIGGMFLERFARGAFADVIKNDVRLLIEHAGLPLARTASGTLSISEDAKGLAIEAKLDGSDPDVQRVKPKLARKDLDQMSIGFNMRGGIQEWDESDPETVKRTIEKVGDLWDVSLVAFGAFPTTDVALRSLRSSVKKTGTITRAGTNERRKRLEIRERENLHVAGSRIT